MTAEDDIHEVRAELEVPGTPEEVWEAIATGPGITAWFIPTELDGRVGGAVTSHYAPGATDEGTVTTWEPGRCFAWEEQFALSEGEPAVTLAHEFLLEANAGGTCVVRIVTSGFGADADWDGFAEGMAAGWSAYLDNLRLVLTHFRGQPCTSYMTQGEFPGSEDAAWPALRAAIGLARASAGDRVTVAPDGPPALAGTLERVGANELVVRTDGEGPGLAMFHVYSLGGPTYVNLHAYLFGEQAEALAARDEPAWQAWFGERFPPS